MFGFGLWELLLLTLLVGLIFGFRRLPYMARNAGRFYALLQKLKLEFRNLLRIF